MTSFESDPKKLGIEVTQTDVPRSWVLCIVGVLRGSAHRLFHPLEDVSSGIGFHLYSDFAYDCASDMFFMIVQFAASSQNHSVVSVGMGTVYRHLNL
jgi:hypothetical protein